MSSCVHCTDFTLVVSYFFIGLNYEYTEEKQILIFNLTNFDPNLIFDKSCSRYSFIMHVTFSSDQ